MRGILTSITLLSAGTMAYGQVLFTDDFESGIVDWTANGASGNNLQATNRNRIPQGGAQSAFTILAGDRSAKTLPTPVTAGEHTIFTAYLYRESVSATVGSTRIPVGVGDSTVAHRFGFGWFNNATGLGDTFQATNYQGKMTDLNVAGNQFFNLNNPGTPTRSIGWHKFDVERTADGTVRFYVDDVLGRTVLPTEYTNSLARSWTSVVVGFGSTSSVGGDAGYDGLLLVKDPPLVTGQPTNQFVSQGATATFSVEATGGTLSYQWRKSLGGTNAILPIVGETSPTLNVPNVGTNDVRYFYSVVTSNLNGTVGSAAATITITIPSIVTSPSSTTVLQGANFTLRSTANGAAPLSYQWQFNSNNIANATNANYTTTNAQVSNSGYYRVNVSNAFGNVFSTNALISVITAPQPDAMTLVWKKVPGDYTWLNTDGTQRGLSYNPTSNHLLVVSRTTTMGIHILDAADGADLGEMNIDALVVAGGTFPINMVGVADDGAVFVANLTLNGTSDPFKIYRWSAEAAAMDGAAAFSGDPGNGSAGRWGDTLDVRGAGLNTQILAASRNGTNVAIFTTTDGLNFTATRIQCDVTANDLGLGAKFGTGDTFWAKSNDATTPGLRHIAFNLGTGVGTTIKHYTNFPTSAANIAVNPAQNLLAAISIETPNNLRLYGITNLNADPVFLDYEFFTPNVAGQATGDIDFGNNRIFALNSNNGIMAMTTVPPVAASITYTYSGNTLTLSWSAPYILQSATDVAGPYTDVVGASSPYQVNVTTPTMTFYRLRLAP